MADFTRSLVRLGVSTLYEAAGRTGLIDLPLEQLIAGSAAAGPARTVFCGQADNLTVHAAMSFVEPGEVLVVTMPEPGPVALVGDILGLQAKQKGVAALLLDAAIRDVEELREIGIPIWSRYRRSTGATKERPGAIGKPVTVGGTEVANGDFVVLDADGAAAVRAERIEEVIVAAEERSAREERVREQILAGALTYDLHGLREKHQRNLEVE